MARPNDGVPVHHLLEGRGFGRKIFEGINRCLENNGVRNRHCTIIDATLIEATSSAKNKEKESDPPDASDRERKR